MIKIDLHMHSGEDPYDGLSFPATALIDRAVELGFGAIAITLHERVLDDPRLFAYARERGLLLIQAVEWNIAGADVLLYNVTQREADALRSWDDLRAFRRVRGEEVLVIAPHPHYPIGASLKHVCEQHIDLFDAIEHSSIHLWALDYNKESLRLARRYHKPVVANSDAHGLWMFGQHYTLVDAEPNPASIFRAIRANRLEWHSPRAALWTCVRFLFIDHLHRRPGKTVESFPRQPERQDPGAGGKQEN